MESVRMQPYVVPHQMLCHAIKTDSSDKAVSPSENMDNAQAASATRTKYPDSIVQDALSIHIIVVVS